MRRIFFPAILFLTATALADGPTINYQGRVTAGGGNYSDQGYFKFVLLNDDGEGLWSNDGSPGTNEPGGSVNVSVNNGLFSVELGEQPMNEIPALAFHQWGLFLRTWFATNGAPSFEQLSPDARIRPIDFSQINTYETVVVHHSGNADFSDIQAAIDCVETNDEVSTILVMPGHYELSAPLTTPSDDWVTVRGLGAAPSDTTVENTNGTAALTPARALFVNMHFVGTPAISTVTSPEDYQLDLKGCEVRAADGAAGPCAIVAGDGSVDVFDCIFERDNGDSVALALSGDARFTAEHSGFSCWESREPAVVLSNFNGSCTFESCTIGDGESNQCSVCVLGGDVHGAEFVLSDLRNGLLVSNAQFGARFKDCRISGPAPVYVVGNSRGIAFEGCNLSGNSNATVYVQDATGGLDFEQCDIGCGEGTALRIVATEDLGVDESVYATCDYSDISNWSDGGTTNADTIVIVNQATNEDAGAVLELLDCSVGGWLRDGINSSGGDVSVLRSGVEGERNGILAAGGNIEVEFSYVECAGGDGISISGVSHLEVFNSDICGDGPGRAVYAAISNTPMPILIQDSTLESPGGPAMECAGGRYIMGGNMFMSGLGPALLIRETNNIVTLDKCRLLSHADIFGATNMNPALLLYGASAVATPRLTHCLLEPASMAPYSIDVQGGAGTGNVYMINSCVSAGISTNVGLLDPGASLGFGNYVVPPGP